MVIFSYTINVSSQELVFAQPKHVLYKPMAKAPCAFASYFFANHFLLIDTATGGQNQ
jgi:hypothetical protein